MSFSYLADLGDQEFDPLATKIRGFAAAMVRLHPTLRGLKLEHHQDKMRITLRVAGLTRWHVQRDAPRMLAIILRKFAMPGAVFQEMVSEPGRNFMPVGMGRTEMTRRPRSQRMNDGRPWDHIAWEGDDLGDAFTPSSQDPASPL